MGAPRGLTTTMMAPNATGHSIPHANECSSRLTAPITSLSPSETHDCLTRSSATAAAAPLNTLPVVNAKLSDRGPAKSWVDGRLACPCGVPDHEEPEYIKEDRVAVAHWAVLPPPHSTQHGFSHIKHRGSHAADVPVRDLVRAIVRRVVAVPVLDQNCTAKKVRGGDGKRGRRGRGSGHKGSRRRGGEPETPRRGRTSPLPLLLAHRYGAGPSRSGAGTRLASVTHQGQLLESLRRLGTRQSPSALGRFPSQRPPGQ